MEEPKTFSVGDPVSAPTHYSGDGHIECKDAMRSMLAGYDRRGREERRCLLDGGGAQIHLASAVEERVARPEKGA